MGKHKPYHAEGHYPLPFGFNGKLAGPYRWFSGRPLNGHRYTNATGFRYGTAAVDISGRANSYQLLPGYKRFLYARLPIMVAPAAAAAFVVEPGQASFATLGVATLAAREVDKWRRTRRFRKQVVEPVAKGVAAVLRVAKPDGQGHTWVSIPEDFRDNPLAKISVQLPPEWIGDDGDKTRLANLVATRLNLPEVSSAWTWTEGRHVASFGLPAKPPVNVSMSDIVGQLDSLDKNELAMGLGHRGELATFSLATESPHLLIAGGSGAGKSVLLAFLVGQLMRRGYGVVVMDAKYISHMWLRQVPGVLYGSEPEELHDALLWMEAELYRRARAWSKGDRTPFQPIVVLMEEMAGATNRLRQHWNSIKVNGDPQQSPAITAMTNLSSMGREMGIHVLMAGQSMTAKTVGGPENRENFAGRTLARATAAQWKMLCPQIRPAPTKKEQPGRWHLVVGDTMVQYQAPFNNLKDDGEVAALIEWATGGAAIPDVPAMMADWDGAGTTSDQGISAPAVVVADGISLRQFADEQGLDLPKLRRWRELKGFPVEVSIGANSTYLYDRDHLKAWLREYLREPVSAGEE